MSIIICDYHLVVGAVRLISYRQILHIEKLTVT